MISSIMHQMFLNMSNDMRVDLLFQIFLLIFNTIIFYPMKCKIELNS